MYEYTKHISPIYSRHKPTDIKPIVDTYIAFNPSESPLYPLYWFSFGGLPKALWRYFEAKTGKVGREAVKKLEVQIKVGGVKSVNGKRCKNIHDLMITSIFDIIANACWGRAFIIFNFGFVIQMVPNVTNNMACVTEFLPLPVSIEMGEL